MSNYRFYKWARVVPIKHRDNLVSSQFSDSPRFIASYENDEKVNMFSLMSHEYAKQWREEKDATNRVVLETQDSDFLMRRYVIRGYLNRRKVLQTKPRFIMKQFQNIPAKVKMASSTKLKNKMEDTSQINETAGSEGVTGTCSEIGDLTKDDSVKAIASGTDMNEEAGDQQDAENKDEECKKLFVICQNCSKTIKGKESTELNKTEPMVEKGVKRCEMRLKNKEKTM
ncbi:uncharacterized protein LOC106668702 [Cimex lectularius]|uniref:Uncharacterized protein n=1 Tax=Cimex lectularius TaxID=79782 RepID=A0A8I6TFV0_CIMLE|nr:uncharacterized protein LOC106668702 [Cimex lectularius]